MNVKFLIINYLLVGLIFGYDANTITLNEIKQLKVIDKNIYDLSSKDTKVDFVQVVHFIFLHLNYDIDFTRLKINATARATNKTKTLGINLTYPIFDRKESNTRAKDIIKLKNDITKNVKSYFKIKLELQELEDEVLILTQLEIRDKARKLDGVGGFNDWLKTINDIKKTKFNIGFKKLELIEAKQILLNYVKPNTTMKLKKILK